MRRVLEHPNGYLCAVIRLYDAKGNPTEDLTQTVGFDFVDQLALEHGEIVEGSASACIHGIQ